MLVIPLNIAFIVRLVTTMAPASDLSPAAQAVLEASAEYWAGTRTQAVAAALRAAVAHTQQHHNHDVWRCDADELLAIATELEAQ